MLGEFGAFLRSRRERVAPEAVGLAAGAGRRTPGLRREELAGLAAVSVDTVVRLEQGRLRPSESVLEALSRALRLTAAERERLFTLARPRTREGVTPRPAPRPALVRLVAALNPQPAYVLDAVLEVLVWNAAASALFGGLERHLPDGPNIARLAFLDDDYRARLGDPAAVEAEAAGALRLAATRHPDDPRLRSLVEELRAGSGAFRARWASDDVREKTHGRKAFVDPGIGRFELDWERLTVPGEHGLALMVYSAEPGSSAADALEAAAALAGGGVDGAGGQAE